MTEKITAVLVWNSDFETSTVYHRIMIPYPCCTSVCVCSVPLSEISNIKTKISPICWSFKDFCHLYVFLNWSYNRHSIWPQFLSSRESRSHSGHVPEIQQLCYTSLKCLQTLLKLIKSLACLIREIEPNSGVINHQPSADIIYGRVSGDISKADPNVPPTSNR